MLHLRIWNLLCQGLTEAALCDLRSFQSSSFVHLQRFLLAKILAARNEIPSAIKALSTDQRLPICNCLLLGQLHFQQGAFEEAIHVLEAYNHSSVVLQAEEQKLFSEIVPEVVSFESLRLMCLAKCFHSMGNVENCISMAKAALEADGGNLELLAWIDKFCILSAVERGGKLHSSTFSILNRQRKFSQSLALTSKEWPSDLEHSLPVHLSNLFHLNDRLALYKLGGELFKLCPSSSPLPFLAVGALYLVNAKERGKNAVESARKYFCKATLLSKTCHWAWEGFALTFSLSFDHDQAIAAYSTLAKLVPASAEPFICIGMEYVRSENALLALKYFDKALLMQPEPDQLPLLFNEIGALHFKEARYTEACQQFHRAIQAANEAFGGEGGEFAGVLHLNLGYALGMAGDWESGARAFEQSSTIWPCREACYAQAVARVLQVKGEESDGLEEALEILVGILQPEEGDSIGEFFDFALTASKEH